MNSKPLKTAYELGDIIVERATTRHGRWPSGMTLFVFDDAYGWSASISRSHSEAEDAYRDCALDLIADLETKFDLTSARPLHRRFVSVVLLQLMRLWRRMRCTASGQRSTIR